MDILVERCAGIDIGKKLIVACVRVPDGKGRRKQEIRSFGAVTAEVLALRDWLVEQRITRVGMESTSDYWKPVYYLLEDDLEVWLLNAAHLKAVPGRKTDVKDAAWIAQLVEHGLVRPSFVPPPPIRELRDLTRYRKSVSQERTRETQRVEKLLEDAGIKLSSVISDIFGVSGRAMLEDLIRGERDPQLLAAHAHGPMIRKTPMLHRALTGRFTTHHALLLREMLARIDAADATLSRLSVEIDHRMEPFRELSTLLTTIPGIGRATAEVIIAETGGDMSRFPTAAHLASWAGVCPGNNESAGKHRSGRARKGNKALRTALVESAHAASHTKNTYLSAHYWRIAGRRGPRRAALATANTLLVISWHVLHDRKPYSDLGGDYFVTRLSNEARTRRLVHDLERLGHVVTLETPAA